VFSVENYPPPTSYTIFEDIDDSLDYVGVGEIIITSDEDLISFSSAGSGTLEDPYMITNYAVYGLGVTYAVRITNVTKHFTIEHCRILSIYGIVIENIPTVQINITDNLIAQFDTFYQVDMITGIKINNCNNITIAKNNIESNFRGIEISFAANISISENNINGRSDVDNLGVAFSGISLRQTMNCTAVDNVFNKGGFEIDLNYDQLDSLVITNNTMKGLEIGFFRDSSYTTISSSVYSQIILFNCSNFIIENSIFLEAFRGIHCLYSSSCRFSNNSIFDGDGGIKCSYSDDLTLEKNLCDENYMGIHLEVCDSSLVENNKCSNTTRSQAIIVEDSTNIIVKKNKCSLNSRGFGIAAFGENITITNNECNYNEMGIFLDNIQNCWVYNNTLNYNGIGSGIMVISGQKIVISYNLLLENDWFGIMLHTESRDVIVHHNSFINNFVPPTADGQAVDDGTGNYWYHPDTLTGNWWSDKGSKRRYAIEGDANNFDYYPLKDPAVLPDENYPLKTSSPYLLVIPTLIIADIIRRNIKKKS
jgi:parallel beta-helix repeat protein